MACLRGVYGNENVMFDQGNKGVYSIYDGKYTLRFWKDDGRKMVCITYHDLDFDTLIQSKDTFSEIQMIYLVFLNACKSMGF